MITKEKFESIVDEVTIAVNQVLKEVGKKNENNYFLFLNNCILIDGNIEFNKEVVLTDESRLNFYIDFLNKNYAFGNTVDKVGDDVNRFFIELMIYTHFWESKNIINKLAQIANLSNGEDYDLEIYKKHPYYCDNKENNEKNKSKDDKIHTYIREKIKRKFISSDLKIGGLFSKIYKSQVRNAFAHSDFYFSIEEKKIFFKNYNENESHTVKSISFNEWSEQFCYTFLISYLFELKIRMDLNAIAKLSKIFQISISNKIYKTRYDSLNKKFIFI